MIDFEYAGLRLSDAGYIVCSFNDAGGFQIGDIGSKLVYNKVSHSSGRKFSLVSTKYEECITAEFDICKNPDIHGGDAEVITRPEYEVLIAFLNQGALNKFYPIDEDGEKTVYFNASFNVQKVMVGNEVYGLRLFMETDSPFAYEDDNENTISFPSANSERSILVKTHVPGYLYPYVEITPDANGTLTIKNPDADCSCTIRNCKAGEVITMFGDTNIVKTTSSSHDIANDFNYDFFRLSFNFNMENGDFEMWNTISASIPCHMLIRYAPLVRYIL